MIRGDPVVLASMGLLEGLYDLDYGVVHRDLSDMEITVQDGMFYMEAED